MTENDALRLPQMPQYSILFFTGASTGSTSGGIKMVRWFIIIKDILLELKQRVHPSAILPLRVGDSVLNPIDLARILVMLEFDISALMGYTGAVFDRFFGSATGSITAAGMLAVWLAVPMWWGLRVFKRKDF